MWVWQVLDDITLGNLDVLDHQGQLDGSLLQRLDHCSTAFGTTLTHNLSKHTHTHLSAGRRLLKQWVCAPLCDPQSINDRLDAVETLVGHAHLVGEAREKMKTLPDLQRLLRQ